MLDSLGELAALYRLAAGAFIGGTLVSTGGHNPLEAAAWEVPVVTGPWMFNFEEISGLLCEAGAMLRLDDPVELADALLDLLGDASRRRQMGQAGAGVVASNGGARARLLAMADALLAA